MRKRWIRLLIVVITGIGVAGHAVAQPFSFKALMTGVHPLEHIPSASGIVEFQQAYYVIGDDSPYLFKLDAAYSPIDSIRLVKSKHLENGRVPKKHKTDFECVAVVPWGKDEDVLVFGSGSGEKRNGMVRVDMDDDRVKVETYSLKKFYKFLAKKIAEPLNIEGACYWNENLILLNRSTNTMFLIDFDGFVECVKDPDKDKPEVRLVEFDLPVVNGMSARFSGATVLAKSDMLLFSASVENSPNWMNAESIIGSYLGIIDLNQLENKTPVCVPIEGNQGPIQEKVESVCVTEYNQKTIKLVGVTDNDDGSSRLLQLEFQKR